MSYAILDIAATDSNPSPSYKKPLKDEYIRNHKVHQSA